MGRLRELHGGKSIILQPEHLIGRGPQCATRLGEGYVSTQHAVVRWSGSAWEIVDRGSRNGTYLNGTPIEPGKPRQLEQGSILAFGHPTESWELYDAAAPQVCVIGLGNGIQLLGTDGVIGVPSDDDPQFTVFRDADGLWKLEGPDSAAVGIEDGHTWTAGGQSWLFSCSRLIGPTVTSEQRGENGPFVMCFAVSRDEEFVELTLEYPTRRVNLGSRSHNYLLLILARARCEDRSTELPETTCGWVDKEQLADSMHMTPQQVDGEVFRIRRHFAQHGIDESAMIIERRPRTKQLRIGASRIRIDQL